MQAWGSGNTLNGAEASGAAIPKAGPPRRCFEEWPIAESRSSRRTVANLAEPRAPRPMPYWSSRSAGSWVDPATEEPKRAAKGRAASRREASRQAQRARYRLMGRGARAGARRGVLVKTRSGVVRSCIGCGRSVRSAAIAHDDVVGHDQAEPIVVIKRKTSVVRDCGLQDPVVVFKLAGVPHKRVYGTRIKIVGQQ